MFVCYRVFQSYRIQPSSYKCLIVVYQSYGIHPLSYKHHVLVFQSVSELWHPPIIIETSCLRVIGSIHCNINVVFVVF